MKNRFLVFGYTPDFLGGYDEMPTDSQLQDMIGERGYTHVDVVDRMGHKSRYSHLLKENSGEDNE